jgi:hypothetical protein
MTRAIAEAPGLATFLDLLGEIGAVLLAVALLFAILHFCSERRIAALLIAVLAVIAGTVLVRIALALRRR